MSGTGERPVAVVTGATGGIGPWIAVALARAGYRTVLVGRDKARLAAAHGLIEAKVAGASLGSALADLSSLGETQALGRTLAATYPAVSVLVNNAGVFRSARERTAEGRELVLATNHLAPFVLTRALRPALSAAAPSRVVNVGSVMSERVGIDPDDLELDRRWGPVRAYARSKLALMMATFEWAERLKEDGVTCNVVHPGAVATGIVRNEGVGAIAWRALTPFLLTPEQGAVEPSHAALSPSLAGVSGCYLKRRRIALPNPLALDPVLRQAVWDATERLAGPAAP